MTLPSPYWPVLMAMLFAAAPAHAQSTGAAPSTRATSTGDAKSRDAGKLGKDDRKFVETVARDNLAEIQAGKLAQSRGADERVKKLGQMMEQDHGKANQELQKIASGKGVTLPTEPDKSQSRMLKELEGKTGADFDKAFSRAAARDHEKAVKLFDKTRKNASDGEVKAFAESTYPAISRHLQMARQISGAGSSARKSKQSSAKDPGGK